MRRVLLTKSLVVTVFLCCGTVGHAPLSIAQQEPEIRMLPPVASPVGTAPLVRLTGSLQLLSWKGGAGSRTFKVIVGPTERVLQLESVETWSEATRSWTMLNDFCPTALHVTGAEDFLGPLQQPEMLGKRISIAGRFHAAKQTLTVTAAAEDAR